MGKKIKSLLSLLLVILMLSTNIAFASEVESEAAPAPLNMEPGVYEDVFYAANGMPMDYRVYVPENATENMPMIVWLHGIGTVNMPEHLNNHGVIRAAKETGEDRFIIIQPCTSVEDWTGHLEIVNCLIDEVASTLHCDLSRIILTGHSLGAIGVWYWANNSDRWAALVPVCHIPFSGTAKLENSEIPMWLFCAGNDSYEIRTSMEQIAKTCAASGTHKDVRFNEIEEVGHVELAYYVYTQEVFDWMYEQTK